ncbi:MAG: Deacetylases, including yeast histone deacetylase and acetoin utilization protein [uncultured Nocardioidaceae bacterium]|uniref:Deacetylases, including yeast histone deacetylase and acetoin utilization protein n=1 Tax=uncultured Nocardioidaceae bacterium TaxID=253824 RepID=A0A6J4L303_9ACTN|nr:MAG: Deacetylases, including yeast histone deacetylase and acetoin utilization protein [uncultured Nocardioidaceae bacterium]
MKSSASRRTGFVCDDSYFDHRTDEGLGPWVAPGPAFETPEGKKRIRDLVVASGLVAELVTVPPSPLSRDDTLRFHTVAYLDSIERMSAGEGGDAGEVTWFGPGSYEIALLSAGGTYAAVRAVVDGEVDNAYALVRPPGHHAERDLGRGYCMLANIALAILKARAELGVGRVAVVDWDVHHGNGTEQAFYDDPETLTISLHQDRLYPRDTGFVEHQGEGPGRMANVNLPLPAGSSRGAYLDAFDRVVEPLVRRFRPELIVVACGFDAGSLDPLGRMMLSAGDFGELTRRVRVLAEELCGGRLVLSHEGGYSELHVPFCGTRVLEELSGASTGIDDPFAWVEDHGGQELQPHQAAAVQAVVDAHRIG